MGTNETGHTGEAGNTGNWRIDIGFTDIEAIAYGGGPMDEGCAGELYLSLAQLTAANDVHFHGSDEQDAGLR